MSRGNWAIRWRSWSSTTLACSAPPTTCSSWRTRPSRSRTHSMPRLYRQPPVERRHGNRQPQAMQLHGVAGAIGDGGPGAIAAAPAQLDRRLRWREQHVLVQSLTGAIEVELGPTIVALG